MPSAPARGGADAAVACSVKLAAQVADLQIVPYVGVHAMQSRGGATTAKLTVRTAALAFDR